jgi:hypothetical protein
MNIQSIRLSSSSRQEIKYPFRSLLKFNINLQNYGLKLHREGAPADQFEYVIKTKGITLDYDACQQLTYAEMRRRVLRYGDDDVQPLTLHYNMIRPDAKRGTVRTINTHKNYKALITKGVIRNDKQVVPFGWFDIRKPSHLQAFSDFVNAP